MKFLREAALSEPVYRSLTASWKEGVVTQAMIGIFDYFLIPFGLFLGATNAEIGMLVAIPNLLVSLSQLFATRFVGVIGSRLRLLLGGTAFQIVVLFLMACLAFLPVGHKIWILVLLISVFRLAGSLVGPAWGSLMSDYLPENMRGRYFGMRSRWMTLAGILGVAFWGGILYLSKFLSQTVTFPMLFFGATFLRFMSYLLQTRMVDMPLHWTEHSHFTFWMFIKRFRESNFVKFIFYVAGVTFATQLAVPQLSVHMLENLGFNYLEYTSVHIAGMFSAMIGFPIWGRHADMLGNARVIKFISFILPVFPLLWIFADSPVEFIGIELLSGFIWGGFSICTTNFIFDAVSSHKRVRCLSYYNLINGAAIFAGASLGGYLAGHLPRIGEYRVHTLFLLSAFLRFASDFFLSKHFTEVRISTHHATSRELFFSVLGLRPISGRHWVWEEMDP